jgi:hypothetical protein
VKRVLFVLFSVLLLPVAGYAGGIQGRAALKGEVDAGVIIYAYKNFDTKLKDGYFKKSEPTAKDGTYKLDLPAGKYYLIARKTKSGGVDLSEGDLYCYYSGSPMDVVGSSYRNIGFNMIKVKKSDLKDKKDKMQGVYGNIYFEDKLLEKVYLFAYKDVSNNFKGPAEYVFPSAKGKFKLRLPEGEFYLLARKRKKGGLYGPMEKDDIFNYYYDNPVKVEKGILKAVDIECITRLDLLEAPMGDSALRGITVHVKEEQGKPLKGVYLLVYTNAEMTGRPDYISERSDEEGKIFLELNTPGRYYTIIRSTLGGPARNGDYYSKYTKDDSSVTLTEDNMYKEIEFKAKIFTGEKSTGEK